MTRYSLFVVKLPLNNNQHVCVASLSEMSGQSCDGWRSRLTSQSISFWLFVKGTLSQFIVIHTYKHVGVSEPCSRECMTLKGVLFAAMFL